MEKRIFTLILVVIIGVLVGVGIVTKQAREPLLRESLKRQTVIIDAQNRMEKALTSRQDTGKSGDARVAVLLQKQQNLEGRIAALESQLKGLQGIFQQAQGAGGNARPAPPQEDLSKVHDIAVAHSPIKGNKSAPVTIVEFVDFQCPFCARFHAPVTQILETYSGKVNYILKNFPLSFHPQAKPASKAAFAAGEQGKYWEMADVLLENGKVLSEEKFEELAKNLGLNVKKFLKDYKEKDAQWEDYIQKDMALAQKVSVQGTPTFYINGRKTNARDFDGFKKEIDQILSGQK